jgi:putative ABC transport system permease protein
MGGAPLRQLYHQIFRREHVEKDLDEEVRVYFEILIERAMARGLTREQAKREVRIAFDGPEQVKEQVRRARMTSALETTLQDLRYSGRLLYKNPGFALFAVLTIALGLGANAAIFSLVDGVLLKATGYQDPERIVQLWEKHPSGSRNGISGANYLDWTREAHSFQAMAAWMAGSMSYSGNGEPVSLRSMMVSAPYFDVFGTKAVLGRTFERDEDQPGKNKVVVLSHHLWLDRFGGDPRVIGRPITLNGEGYTVVGVLPSSSPFERASGDLWVPLTIPPNAARDYHYLLAAARLKPGISVAQAQAEMSSIAARIATLYPAIKKGWGAVVDRYIDRIVGPNLRLSLTVLMWAVVAVLAICCANLSNLLMARATLRSREIALRVAIGASQRRVIRMLLTESLVLSVGGALVGIGLGYALLKWIRGLLPPFYLPAEANIGMDHRVLLFLAGVTVLTSIAFGLAPAIEASRRDTAESLKEGGRAMSASRSKIYLRHLFVTGQVAVALILLVGAGLLIRSFERLLGVDIGFNTEGVMAASLPLEMERNPDAARLRVYITDLLEKVRAVPGVRDAGVASALPLNGGGEGMPFRMPDKPDKILGTGFKIVTPGYFHTLELRLIEGRFLDERDRPGSPPVVVVDQSFVKEYFPNQDPIGKQILVERILASRRGLGPLTAWQIVGVVSDEKANGLDAIHDDGVYASFAQNPVVGLGIVVRGRGDSGALIKSVEWAIWQLNKTQVLDQPRTLEEIKADSLMTRRLPMMLLGGFAALAMLLACAGIYGVLSFVTARRTQEIGIRAALGASRSDLVRMVVADGSMPVLAGIGGGAIGAIGLTRFIQSMLFATKPIDVPTLFGVSGLFIIFGLLACLAPAWRAAKIEPMSALREE